MPSTPNLSRCSPSFPVAAVAKSGHLRSTALLAAVLATVASAQGGPGQVGEKVFNPNTGLPSYHAVIDLDEAATPAQRAAVLTYLQQRQIRARQILPGNIPLSQIETWWANACAYFPDVEQPWNFYELTCRPGANVAWELAQITTKFQGKGMEALQNAASAEPPQSLTLPPNFISQQAYNDPALAHLGTCVGCVSGSAPGDRGTHNLHELNHPAYQANMPGGVATGGTPNRVYLIEADWIDGPTPHIDLDPALIPLLPLAIPAQYPGWSFWSSGNQPSHGAAVLGILNGRSAYTNASGQSVLGIEGTLPGLIVEFIPWFIAPNANSNGAVIMTEGIYAALGDPDFQPRDTLLLEVQWNVNYCATCTPGQQPPPLFAPATWRRDVRTAIQLATSAGMHVVQPAGNSGVDLATFGASIVDDGSILVAGIDRATGCAGTWASGGSNYGTRVDICSEGTHVVTLGYGDLFSMPLTGNPQTSWHTWYTDEFNGTSAAGAIACALVASLVREGNARAPAAAAEVTPQGEQPGWPFDPRTLRKALRYDTSGCASVGGYVNGGLGVYPDAEQVLRRLSARPFSRGQDSDCGALATNCAWPVLKTWKDCGAWSFSEPRAIPGSTFDLWLDTVPTGALVTLFEYPLLYTSQAQNGLWGPTNLLPVLALQQPIGSGGTYCGGITPVVDGGMYTYTYTVPPNTLTGHATYFQAYVTDGVSYSGVSEPLMLRYEP
jgi:hypothetical protein